MPTYGRQKLHGHEKVNTYDLSENIGIKACHVAIAFRSVCNSISLLDIKNTKNNDKHSILQNTHGT